MRNRLRPRRLLLIGVLTLSLVVINAPSASAHTGNSIHNFCFKQVQPRSFCSGWDGVEIGFGFTQQMDVSQGFSNPSAEVCAIVDIYRRTPAAYVKRIQKCGMRSVVMQTGTGISGYNGLNYYEIAYAYNRSSHAVPLYATAVGYGQGGGLTPR